MSNEEQGYKTAFKATAIFGGTQVITIILGVLRNKVIAIWLGSFGLGLIGLYTIAINLVSNITNLGLQSSSVREIAVKGSDLNSLAKVVKALRKWSVATGLIGMLLFLGFSPLLSKYYFNDFSKTLDFALLSIVILLQGLNLQEQALLQGQRKIQWLVKANIGGALITFLCSVPFYYFFRNDGIVPSLICTALGALLCSSFYSRKIQLPIVALRKHEIWRIGKNAAKLGIAMSASSILVSIVELIVRSFISKTGSIEDVGLYTAAWTINGSYLALVFTAMAKDYYPRLSQCNDDKERQVSTMNQQGEIAILILAPLIALMIVFVPWIIKILYSEEFMIIKGMVIWLLAGSLIKGGSWGMSWIMLAKGDSKLFLTVETVANLLSVSLYLVGYHLAGLKGIGIGFFVFYSIYFFIVRFFTVKKYDINYGKPFYKLFCVLIIFLISLLIINQLNLAFAFNISIAAIIIVFSSYCLNKRLPLIDNFHKIKDR